MFGNFGQNNTPTFGGGGFSSSTTNTGVFGQPQQQQPTVATSLFGGFNQPKTTFGSSFGSPQTTTMFGQPNRLQAPTTGGSLFSGQTATVSPFSSTGQTMGQTMGQTQQVPAGTSFPFTAISGTDTMMKGGQASPINTRHQCITCMKEYENKSLEELRLEDYQLNRKGPQPGGMFGSTQPQQQTTGLFSSLGANSTTTAFGQPSTFGAVANTSTPSTGWGLFSNNNTFNNQAKPQTGSFFSTPAPAATSTAFGANPAFSFNPTSQSTSVFGAGSNPVSTGTLGQTSSFTFGQPQAQQPQNIGIFNKPMTSATSTGFGLGGGVGGFGSGAFTNTSTANKPALGFTGFGTSTAPSFGTTTTNFGTGTSGNMFGGGFQSQPQNKPFSFATPFASQSQAQPTQPTFGAPSTGFSFNTTTSTAPTLGFGTSSNTFGGLGNTMNSFSTPSFGSTQPNVGFGFGLNTTSTPGFSSFTPSTMFTQAVPQQQTAPQSGNFGFATTPYKDSPLFYNLIANRDLDNMIKPTSPAAQRAIKEASRRRTSISLTFSSPLQVSKNATFPTSPAYGKQLAIFDGFEDEEDKGFTIDILSPKTTVKKLTLKSFKHSIIPNHRHSISYTVNPHFGENGFNDSEVSVSDFPIGRRSEGRSVISDNNSPTKSVDESVVPPNERPLGSSQMPNQKRQSFPEPPLNDVFEEHKCRVINTRAGYYINPPIEELDRCLDGMGNCYINELVIGRHGHGEIRFLEIVNVAGANIDDIVHFRHKEVVVYPDDTNKPPVGSGLNCQALVCLDRVWPIDKITKDPIKYPPQLQTMGYEDSLRRSCSRLGAEFISYVPETGIWTFKVPHFSKYSCDVEEAEADNIVSPHPTVPVKGLGGMLMPQTQYTTAPKPLPLQTPIYESFSNANEGRTQLKLQQMEIEEDLPIFRNRVRGQSTPLVPTTTEESGFAGGDIEHNPLSPSDSNDSDSDWIPHDLNRGKGQYESVLKGKSETMAVRMMKSALMCSDLVEGTEEMEIQPPSKKFRSPLARTKIGTTEMHISEVKQRKSHLELKQRKHGPPVKTLVTLPEQPEGLKASSFGTNYVASIIRRDEIPSSTHRKENLFAKLSLYTTNGNRYKAGPRVTFGPLGTFVTIGKNSFTLAVNKFSSYSSQAAEPLYIDLLEEQLKKQMSWPKPRAEDQSNVLWNFRHQNHRNPKWDHIQKEIMMWELFQILWPNNEEDTLEHSLETRHNVSKWLSKFSNELFFHTYGMDPKLTVLGLMKMGRREEACQLAIKTHNPYLALLISQAPLEKVTYSNCEEQLEVWKEVGALDYIPDDIKIIYRLCAGSTILDSIDLVKMTTSEWLQHFAIYLWYCCPPQVSVNEAVSSFQQLLKNELIKRTGLVEEKIRHIAFPSVCDSSLPHLCIQLLKLFSFDGYPLRNLLDPETYSEDSLDYKLAWLLMVHLRCKNFKVYEDHFVSIATSFSYQLEQIGLYPWSIFVMSRTHDRTVYHDTLVERNLGPWGTVGDEEFLLRNSLVCHPRLLYTARVMRESRDSREYGGIWYLLKSGNVHKAFDELQKFFTVDIISSGETVDSFLKLIQLFKPFSHKLRNWNSRGSFMLDTLQLLQARTITSARSVVNIESNLTHAQFCNLVNTFLRSFVQFKPTNMHEYALCIELAVLVQRIVAALMSNGSEAGKNVAVANVSALFDLPIPKDYKDELRYFVSAWLK